MAIDRAYRSILAVKDKNSTFQLVVEKVDFELELFDYYGSKFSVNRDQLDQIDQLDQKDQKEKNKWPELQVITRYVIRYTNNYNKKGFIEASIIQILDDGRRLEIGKFSYYNLIGPAIIELPFYIAYKE